MPQNKLQKLEALRGFAALYVVMHHLTITQNDFWGYLFSQGQAAVILFFIISGFVIYYSSQVAQQNGKFTFKTYFIKRFRRIYPVFLASLLFIYLAASYDSQGWLPPYRIQLMGNILNLQDMNRFPGNWFEPYYSDTPIWSLSYEWWFYMLFFTLFKYVRPASQKYWALIISVAGIISFCLIPNKISITLEYFVIWWSGVEIARSWVANKKINAAALNYLVLSYGIMLFLLISQVIIYKGDLKLTGHPVIELLHYIYAIIIITVGYVWHKYGFKGFSFLFRPFVFFGPISYGIYVFHPAFLYEYQVFSFKEHILNVIAGFITVFLLAYIFEVIIQQKINKLTNKLLHNDTKNNVADMLDSSKLQP